MFQRMFSSLFVLVLVIGLSGCGSSMTRGERGALIGAGIGTAAGALIDDEYPARGAVVGAAAGALGGYVIGQETDDYHDGYGPGYHDHGHAPHGYPGDSCNY